MNKEIIINNLINKTDHLKKLLLELKQSVESEKYKYILTQVYKMGEDDIYILYDRESGLIKLQDTLERVKSYMNIRNINNNNVYNHNM